MAWAAPRQDLDALSVSPFELVQFNPVGSELGLSGLFGGATIHLSVLDLRSLTSTQLELADQRSYAWSPDGAWLAVATGEQIVIYGSVRSDPIYVLPIGATTIAWRANSPRAVLEHWVARNPELFAVEASLSHVSQLADSRASG